MPWSSPPWRAPRQSPARPFLLRQRWGGDGHAARQFFAERAAEVGHRAKVGYAPAINPLKDLPPVKSGNVNGGEMCFDLVELQLSRVDAMGGRHGAIGLGGGIGHCTTRFRAHSGVFLP